MARHITTDIDMKWFYDDARQMQIARGEQDNGTIKQLYCLWKPDKDTYIVRMGGGDERTFDSLQEAIDFYNTL